MLQRDTSYLQFIFLIGLDIVTGKSLLYIFITAVFL